MPSTLAFRRSAASKIEFVRAWRLRLTLADDLSLFTSPGVAGPPAVLLALAIDRLFGEPAARWHPVVWMGTYLDWAGLMIAPPMAPPSPPNRRVFWHGAIAWTMGLMLVLVPALGIMWLMHSSAWWWQALLLGFFLKPMLAWRMLHDEVHAVEVALRLSVTAGRERLAYLVSRDASTLDAAQVRESAIESLAENLNDSVIAPLFWFALAGLPGVVIYRFANTADAMWGYLGERNGRHWSRAGKWAARADDVLSWLPARLTAVLLCAVGGIATLRLVPSQARYTASPNSGWPMAAMALVLNVRLTKPGVYVLNGSGHVAQRVDTERALQLALRVVQIIAAAALLMSLLLLFRTAP